MMLCFDKIILEIYVLNLSSIKLSGCTKQFSLIQLPFCNTLLCKLSCMWFTVISQVFTSIFQMESISVVKFAICYKLINIWLVLKSLKFWEKKKTENKNKQNKRKQKQKQTEQKKRKQKQNKVNHPQLINFVAHLQNYGDTYPQGIKCPSRYLKWTTE